MKGFCTIFVFCSLLKTIISLSCSDKVYDDANFQALVDGIDTMLLTPNTNQTVPLRISKAIRNIFHDCVSGCNGMIDLNATDNIGLSWIYTLSNKIYKTFVLNKKPPHKTFYGLPLSFADVLALIGCRAVKLACPDCNKVDFKFCRVDATATENKEIFVGAVKSWPDQEIFFRENFKTFDIPKDVVAIMGAHNIGNTCLANSGFALWWTTQDNILLDNQFYKNLANKDINLKYVNTVNSKGKCQWFTSGKENKSMMLNSDMALWLDFKSDSESGCNPNCSYNGNSTSPKCPRNLVTSDYVNLYAENVTIFREDFIVAFNKMIENGYSLGQLVDPLVSKECPSSYTTSKEVLKLILKNAEKSSKKEQFKIYHFLFNKKYSLNTEEAIKRYQIFKTNLNHIKEQNEKSSYIKYGINRFFDQTVDEYLGKMQETGDFIELKNIANVEDYSHLDLDAAK